MAGGLSSVQTWRSLLLLSGFFGMLWMVHHETTISAQRLDAEAERDAAHLHRAARPSSSSEIRGGGAFTDDAGRRSVGDVADVHGMASPSPSSSSSKAQRQQSSTKTTAPKAPGCWKTRPSSPASSSSGGNAEAVDAPYGTMTGGCIAASEDWQSARVTLDEYPMQPEDDVGQKGVNNRTTTANARHRFPIFTFGGQEEKGKTIRYAHMATAAVLPNGTLVSAWQASTLYEGASDQRIYWSTSDDCGHSWRPPEPLDVPATVPGGAAQWSPVLWLEPPVRGAAAAGDVRGGEGDRRAGGERSAAGGGGGEEEGDLGGGGGGDHQRRRRGGGGSSRRLLLFYTQSSKRECVRPAVGKQPHLWVPGGDVKMTALMETLPAPKSKVFKGEDVITAQLGEWGLEAGLCQGATGGGGGKGLPTGGRGRKDFILYFFCFIFALQLSFNSGFA